MDKITLGVYKSFKNSGNRNHRDKTKKQWCHYFLDLEDQSFHTEWISKFKALILKRNIFKKLKFVCIECGFVFEGLVKKDSDSCDCPQCDP